MTTIATLVVKLVGDISEYSASLRESQEMTGSFSDRAVNGLSAIGGSIVLGALATGAAAVAGIGLATWNASETIDDAYDTIQVGTGKTGEALDGLQQSFNNVFANTPTDANNAAVAIGELNTRLGLTDEMLETSSTKLLRMTDLLGGDIQVNAGLFARVMGDWAVPLEENDILLDKIFRASQITGVGVDKLMTNVVQFGAPMRNMNFGLDESIALFAKWEKEGVNAELVMGSLRQAAGRFADENIPLRQGLDDTFESIKNASSGSEALGIAMDVFGARAAGDMAAAIREGRFDIDDMVAALGNAEGAIMDTSAATADWPEMWGQFTNNLTVQLAPMGDVLRNIAGEAIGMFAAFVSRPEVQEFIAQFSLKVQEFGGMVLTWMPQIATGLENGLGWLDQNKGVVVAALAMVGTAILAFAYTSVAAAIPAVIAFVTAMWPVLLVVGLVGAAAYLLYEAWTNNWGGIQEKTQTVIAFVQGLIQGGLVAIQGFWSAHGAQIMGVINSTWQFIQFLINSVMNIIRSIQLAIQAAMRGDWYAFGEYMREAFEGWGKLLSNIVQTGWAAIDTAIKGLITNVINFFKTTDWGAVGRGIVEGIAKGLLAGAGMINSAAKTAAQNALDAAKGFLGIKSPSTVFQAQVGWQMAAGMAQGWETGVSDMMPKTMGEIVPVKSGGVGGGAMPRGGQATEIHIHIESPTGIIDEEETARRLAPALRYYLRQEGIA